MNKKLQLVFVVIGALILSGCIPMASTDAPAAEPMGEETMETVTEPVMEETAEPAAEPVIEEATEPVAEPATEDDAETAPETEEADPEIN